MSKDLPQPQPSEEVELGQLFKLIGNAFDRFFKFIGNIFKNLFLAFVWFVFFIKTHIIKLAIAGVVGLGIGILLDKTSDPMYRSYITIKQNYSTGENIYNSINYYNDLMGQKDINTLKNILGIQESEANSIIGFDIEPVVTENQKIQNFDAYIKTLDSAVASKVKYETFVKNSQDFSYEFQQISIRAKERSNFKKVFDKIIENINNNEFFKREQEKDLAQLKEAESSILEALKQSDSLQNTYKRVLEKVIDKNNGSQTSVVIEGANQIDKTKEFELYKSDLLLRDKLVENRRRQADKQFIVEILSSKQDSGVIDNSKVLFKKHVSIKTYYLILFVGVTFMVLLALQFIKFLEKYKN